MIYVTLLFASALGNFVFLYLTLIITIDKYKTAVLL